MDRSENGQVRKWTGHRSDMTRIRQLGHKRSSDHDALEISGWYRNRTFLWNEFSLVQVISYILVANGLMLLIQSSPCLLNSYTVQVRYTIYSVDRYFLCLTIRHASWICICFIYLFIFLFIDVLKYILYVHKNAFWMDGLITST